MKSSQTSMFDVNLNGASDATLNTSMLIEIQTEKGYGINIGKTLHAFGREVLRTDSHSDYIRS